MRAIEWQKHLQKEYKENNKNLFYVTELANIACVSRHSVNVQLSRLRKQNIIVQYAYGIYGLPDIVLPEDLLEYIDPHAYATGEYVLYITNIITQMPSYITCFSDKRSPRAKNRNTPVGRFVFKYIVSGVYLMPEKSNIANPEQAFCDYIYIMRKARINPISQVTFRNLHKLNQAKLEKLLNRYPKKTQAEVKSLMPK